MKKRILSVILAIAFILTTSSLLAFAAEEIPATVGTIGVDPNATIGATDEEASVSVNVTWDSMNFKYNFGDKWDPKTHSYVASDGSALGWDKTSADITVTNHSNIAVKADVEFVKNAEEKALAGVTAGFNKASAVIDSAVGTQAGVSEVFTLSVAGAPSAAVSAALGVTELSIAGAAKAPLGLNASEIDMGAQNTDNEAGLTEPLVITSSVTGRSVTLLPGEERTSYIAQDEVDAYKAVVDDYIDRYGYSKMVGDPRADKDGSVTYEASYFQGVVDIELFDWNRNGTVEMMIIYSTEPRLYHNPQYLDIFAIQDGEAVRILTEEPGCGFGSADSIDGNAIGFTMVNNRLDLIVHHSTNTILDETIYAYVNGKADGTNVYAELTDEGFVNPKINGKDVTAEEFEAIYAMYTEVEWETMTLNSDPVNAEYTYAFLDGRLDSYSVNRAYPCWSACYASDHKDWFDDCEAFVTNLTVIEKNHTFDENGVCVVCGTECEHGFWYTHGESCPICGKENPDFVAEGRVHDVHEVDGHYVCSGCGHDFGTECPHDADFNAAIATGHGAVCTICGKVVFHSGGEN